jgi:hypothetical protein
MLRAIVILLVVGLGVAAFWRGWLQADVTNKPQQTDTTLTVNKDKIQQDLEYLKKQERALFSKPASDFAETTVHGHVQTLGRDQLTLLAADGKTVNVKLVPETTIRIGDKTGTVTDLRIGDPVTVEQVTRGDRLVATSVTVAERKS